MSTKTKHTPGPWTIGSITNCTDGIADSLAVHLFQRIPYRCPVSPIPWCAEGFEDWFAFDDPHQHAE